MYTDVRNYVANWEQCHSGGRIRELTAAVVQTGAWLKPHSLSVSKQDFSANTTSQSEVRHFNALAGGDSLRIST